MVHEFQSFVDTQTETIVPPTNVTNLIGCRWIFQTKLKPNEYIYQRKARLIANEFHQQGGIEYTETFSPLVKPTTILLVLSLTVTNG